MALDVPNSTNVGGANRYAYLDQAEPDSLDFQMLGVAGSSGVVSGCGVNLNSGVGTSPTVDVASGVVLIAGTRYPVSSISGFSLGSAPADSRFDMVVARLSGGTISIVNISGPSATNPVFPPTRQTLASTVTYNNTAHIDLDLEVVLAAVYRSGNSTLTSSNIVDKRIVVHDPSVVAKQSTAAPTGGVTGSLHYENNVVPTVIGQGSGLFVKNSAGTWVELAHGNDSVTGKSVVGRANSTAGSPEYITSSTDHAVLTDSGNSTLEWAKITSDNVSTSQTITLSGDISGSGTISNLGNVTITTAYNNAVVLGTDTSGTYVRTFNVTANRGLTVNATSGAVTLTQSQDLRTTGSPTFSSVTATTFSGNATSATTAGSATNATKVNVSTNSTVSANRYVTFVAETSGNQDTLVSTGLKYNPLLNRLYTGRLYVEEKVIHFGDATSNDFISYDSTNNNLSITLNNSSRMQVTGSNTTMAGYLSVTGNITSGGDITAAGNMTCVELTETSDARYKTITGAAPGMDFFRELDGVSWRWSDSSKDDGTHWGTTAQALQAAIVAVSGDSTMVSATTPDSDRLGVRFSELWGPLINALKELDERIAALEA